MARIRSINPCAPVDKDAIRIRRPAAHVRKKVLRRDHGICAWCGLDCERLRRIVFRLRALPHRYRDLISTCKRIEAWSPGSTRGIWDGFPYAVSLWNTDHIVAFSDGGPCELTNLRTLCNACHKIRTAQWRGERAAR